MDELVNVLSAYYTNYFWTIIKGMITLDTVTDYNDALRRYIYTLRQDAGYTTALMDIAQYYSKHAGRTVTPEDVKSVVQRGMTEGGNTADRNVLTKSFLVNTLNKIFAEIQAKNLAGEVLAAKTDDERKRRAADWMRFISAEFTATYKTFNTANKQNDPGLLKQDTTNTDRYHALLGKYETVLKDRAELAKQVAELKQRYMSALIELKKIKEVSASSSMEQRIREELRREYDLKLLAAGGIDVDGGTDHVEEDEPEVPLTRRQPTPAQTVSTPQQTSGLRMGRPRDVATQQITQSTETPTEPSPLEDDY